MTRRTIIRHDFPKGYDFWESFLQDVIFIANSRTGNFITFRRVASEKGMGNYYYYNRGFDFIKSSNCL